MTTWPPAPVAMITTALRDGPGWCVGKWLDDQFESDNAAIASVLAFSEQLGVVVPQDEIGSLTGLVRDEGNLLNEPTSRGYRTPDELPLHNDRADLVVLHCVRQASHGGELGILELAPLISALKSNKPALLEKLKEPFPFDLRRVFSPHEKGWCPVPIITDRPEFQGVWYCNLFIKNAERFGRGAKLTCEQCTTLDEFEKFIRDMRLVRTIRLKPGETLVMNSHHSLHSRRSFVDDRKLSKGRLMVRIWLTPPWASDLPTYYEPLFGCIQLSQPRGGFGSAQ
jgi:Taurine catabolism dioxygenase TauD, TfdA family